MDQITVRALIHGRVQGVGFRWWTKNQARRLNIGGWVRNRADGSVEVLASGPMAAVEELLENCLQGPRSATVESMERFDEPYSDHPDFITRPTP